MAPYRTARAQKIPSCHAGEPLTRSHQSATGAGRGAGAASIAAPARREILSKGEVQGQHQKASSLRQGKPVVCWHWQDPAATGRRGFIRPGGVATTGWCPAVLACCWVWAARAMFILLLYHTYTPPPVPGLD